MVVNILFIGLLSVYCAIVLIGHALLVKALWPELFAKRPATEGQAGEVHADAIQPAPRFDLSEGRLAA